MKALHLSVSLSRRAGGVFEIELALAQYLQGLGVDVVAMGLMDSDWSKDSVRWPPVPATACSTLGPSFFGYAPTLLPSMFSAKADLVHLHNMWMYPSVAVRRWATATRKPYLVTPNGMLEPWALKNSAWKKKLAGMFYENRMLRGAVCLQANTEKEATDFRAYGLKTPIAIIPNGIDIPIISNTEMVKSSARRENFIESGRKVLLYLGRIHPKKGLVNLFRAWASVNRNLETWVLAIAGWDQGGHEEELKRLATELGLRWQDARDIPVPNGKAGSGEPPSIAFLGPQFNEAKFACYRDCDAFILPSVSEGLPMVVLEAWACEKPVLMTPQCNLPEGFMANAAIRINPDVDGIEHGLYQLFQLSPSDLCSLGVNGRKLILSRFTWAKVAVEMKSVYEWVLGGGTPPGCISIH